MKKFAHTKIVLLLLMFIFGIFIIYNQTSTGFVERNFVKYTGVKEYITCFSYHDNVQSYFEVIISQSSKRLLLKKLDFVSDMEKLKGRIEPNFISLSEDFIYHIIDDGYGPYGYILIALEKNGNKLKVYEFYGD